LASVLYQENEQQTDSGGSIDCLRWLRCPRRL